MPSPLTVFGALNLNARNLMWSCAAHRKSLQMAMSGFLTQPVLSAQAVVNLKKTRETLGEKAKNSGRQSCRWSSRARTAIL